MTSDVAPGGSVIASECVLALDSLDSHVPRATAVDRQVVHRETQRASVVGYSCWESVASQAALEAVGEEGCPSCGRTSRCRRGPEVGLWREGEQAPDCSRAAARTKVGKREREGPR